MQIFSTELESWFNKNFICRILGHKSSDWMEVCWALGHSCGYWIKRCERCGEELNKTEDNPHKEMIE